MRNAMRNVLPVLAGLSIVVSLVASLFAGEKVNELSQYGITWKFEKPVESGKFVNGDWWVIGPVNIVSVTPAPGPGNDSGATEKKNPYGASMLKDDNRMRNGSMVVLKPADEQGYDSRGLNYSPEKSMKFPYVLETDRSLISTESNKTLPNNNFCYKLMWKAEQTSGNALKTAAVLTCLKEVPPEDAFRPAYSGTEKKIYRAKDLHFEKLLKLEPSGTVPSWEDYNRYFQRAWLDHATTDNWTFDYVAPVENQPQYSRESSRIVSIASLLLNLNVPEEQKKTLLIELVQLGIDLRKLYELGVQWRAEGGFGYARKWPILFAGIMLGDEELQKLPGTAIFGEDQTTYYGKGSYGQTVLWQMVWWGGPALPHEEKAPEQWTKGKKHSDEQSEGYRVCCSGPSWIGTALAARLMKAMKVWGHDAFFDYCDRWMTKDDPYKSARGKNARPSQEGKAIDAWVDAMWSAYRNKAPEQAGAEKNLKWVWDAGATYQKPAGKWVTNNK